MHCVFFFESKDKPGQVGEESGISQPCIRTKLEKKIASERLSAS